ILKRHIYDGNVEIEGFYILNQYRGKTYGSQMLEHLLRDRLEEKVYLWVLIENLAAQRFYERNGFYDTGKTRVIYRGCEFTQCLYQYRIH
ncbi:MAG TPA: GNAT family N-acetyltransferase, partial [Lachnospiraceae bacterium]|nr:GNAT family N-acetyltransferase [Lachnospiraceae bacterium]